MTWPVTLGHEMAGTIAELGDGVEGFAVGDRVAVGWFGGNCNRCIPCRQGKFMQCENGQVPSWHYPGGYAESVTAPATALARIPDELSFTEAAPMGCAGVTTYNVALGFATSEERESARVRGDYQTYLGRGASASEVAGWVDQFKNHGQSSENLGAGFVGSDEYYTGRGHGNHSEWVRSTYHDVLFRDAADADLTYWTGRMI